MARTGNTEQSQRSVLTSEEVFAGTHLCESGIAGQAEAIHRRLRYQHSKS